MTEVPPDPPVDEDPDDDGLSVDELDFTRYEEVTEIEDGRYVIETDGPVNASDDLADAAEDQPSFESDEATPPAVYAVHAQLIAGEERSEVTIQTDDVVTAFDDLLAEFAETVSGEMTVEDTLDLLLTKSEVAGRDA